MFVFLRYTFLKDKHKYILIFSRLDCLLRLFLLVCVWFWYYLGLEFWTPNMTFVCLVHRSIHFFWVLILILSFLLLATTLIFLDLFTKCAKLCFCFSQFAKSSCFWRLKVVLLCPNVFFFFTSVVCLFSITSVWFDVIKLKKIGMGEGWNDPYRSDDDAYKVNERMGVEAFFFYRVFPLASGLAIHHRHRRLGSGIPGERGFG